MSLYNMLFGKNPNDAMLKNMLELGTKYHIGRYRDIYLNEDGTMIILYTRNGGGNRECYDCDKDSDKAKANCDKDDISCGWNKQCCPLKATASLRMHPNYVKDYDDEFDCTYAYYEFTVPDKHKTTAKLMSGIKEQTISEKLDSLLEEMKTMSKEEIEKDKRFEPLKKLFDSLTDETQIKD